MKDNLIILPAKSYTWDTKEGANYKMKEMKRKGIPDLKNWRFVTLTCFRNESPYETWRIGNDWMRRFLALLRKEYGPFRWLWKLEFHQDGYPHWHLLLEIKRILPKHDVDTLWSLGFSWVERVTNSEMGLQYMMKYCGKDTPIPEWHSGKIIQTSRGFFTNPKKYKKRTEEKKYCKLPLSREERERRRQYSIRLIKPRKFSKTVPTKVPYKDVFSLLIHKTNSFYPSPREWREVLPEIVDSKVVHIEKYRWLRTQTKLELA